MMCRDGRLTVAARTLDVSEFEDMDSLISCAVLRWAVRWGLSLPPEAVADLGAASVAALEHGGFPMSEIAAGSVLLVLGPEFG